MNYTLQTNNPEQHLTFAKFYADFRLFDLAYLIHSLSYLWVSDITEVVLEDQGFGEEKGLFVEYGELGTLKSVEVEYGGVE